MNLSLMDDMDKILNNKPAVRRTTSNTLHASTSATSNAEAVVNAAAVAALATAGSGPEESTA